ncbi:MAG: TonB-dependent receptor [Roseivirga sp.]|nr:TonB-dependent receptor [Roseivirga sp.]
MKKVLLQVLMAVMMVTFSVTAYGQSSGTLKGRVVDSESGEGVFGATVVVVGASNKGAVTEQNGDFRIAGLSGAVTLKVTSIGYTSKEVKTTVNGDTDMGSIQFFPSTDFLGEIVVTSSVIDIAKQRETPIAVSTISPAEISLKIGNQEFPEIMNKTPGVYATKNGGGYGDSRLSLRGFDQRNTSFLINGQPVNDMENGWVYWSNWQGLTDVASGIQIQRGLGASRLAVPSVGGTVSIFTKAAEREKGGAVTLGVGNDGYVKTTGAVSTGLNDNGWAASFLLSRWSGNGYVDNTSGEGWTYFAAIGYAPEGSKHSFNLSMLGAGQWHHQRSVWVSIRDYQNFGESGVDPRWNTNGGTLNGEEYNIRRNFYNKPLATFNWDWDINDNMKLATSLYGSAGRGGGTGPRGNNFRNNDINVYPFRRDLTEHLNERGNGAASRHPDGTINFDNIVAVNQGTTNPYNGDISRHAGRHIGSNGFRNDGVNRAVLVRRASMNSHNWVGAISSLDITKGKWSYSVGVDLRSYTGYHYRVLNDLLGLDGYYSTGNRNSNGKILESTIAASPFRDTGLNGEKIDYYNIGKVGWQGFNGLVEYNDETSFTAVLQAGFSNQSFQRIDHFDQPTYPVSEKVDIVGGYVKGGANYNLNAASNIFFNTGFISRQPLFDAVFPNFQNAKNLNLQNEIITSFELGYGYTSTDFDLNVNAYTTTWGNRFLERTLQNQLGDEGTAQIQDVDSRHMGLEMEATYRANDRLKLRGMISAGDWKYTKDFDAELFDANRNSIGTGTLYTEDVKVGDAAQFTSYIEADYRVGNFNFDMSYRFVDGLYADYSIEDASFADPDNQGALKLPSYGLVDLGATWRFDLMNKGASFRVNVNNLLNTIYIAESNTNIHAEATSTTWEGVDVRNSVWFGFGTTWNATFRWNF